MNTEIDYVFLGKILCVVGYVLFTLGFIYAFLQEE